MLTLGRHGLETIRVQDPVTVVLLQMNDAYPFLLTLATPSASQSKASFPLPFSPPVPSLL